MKSEFNHSIAINQYSADVNEVRRWCTDKFGYSDSKYWFGRWCWNFSYDRDKGLRHSEYYFYFKEEQDAVLFALRWA